MKTKKILSLVTALSITAACGASAFAADKEKGEPDVIVDGSKIIFSDQSAKIVDDVTLVPARGVFEAMDCKVDWNDTERTVTVTSSTGVKEVIITIDSDVMKIRKFKSLFESNESDYTLEVPAQIINDRTMIPLRAVSEAFECNVEWDGDAYAVNITTGDPELLEGYTYTAPDEDSLVHMSLSTDKTGELEEGEEFTVYIDAKNIPADSFCSGVTGVIEYDKAVFEYVEGSCTLLGNNDEPFEGMGSVAPGNKKGVRFAFITIDADKARNTDGHVFSLKFKSLNGNAGDMVLGNDFTSLFGYESYLGFMHGTKNTEYMGKDLNLDRTPLTIGE